MKKIASYITDDGQTFQSAKAAKAHEAALSLDKLLGSWFDGAESVSLEQLRDEMIASSWTLINLLSSIARQTPLGDEEEEDQQEAEAA
jgi:hypothetical protein